MALKILDSCINCDMCDPECPNEAITMGPKTFVIDPDKCTECIGHYDTQQCVDVCPIACITTDPDRIESTDELLVKFGEITKET